MLAGIPSIVYGLFALVTVGLILRDYFAQPTGLGIVLGLGHDGGMVMGIMLIPDVSSLSDDIINAVPRAMRDGSLGLGGDPVRDDQARNHPRRAAGHRRPHPARRLARHR